MRLGRREWEEKGREGGRERGDSERPRDKYWSPTHRGRERTRREREREKERERANLQYPGLHTGSVMTIGCLMAVCLCSPR